MKVSEIQVSNIVDYIILESGQYKESDIQVLLDVSKAYIRSYTGLTNDEIDEHEDFIIVVYVLCQDMHDNRSMYIDNKNLNRTVESILGMHRINLI